MSELRRPFGLHLFHLDSMVMHMDTATIQLESLAGAIRDAIARSGKSQRDVAEQAGIPLATLSRRGGGRRAPTQRRGLIHVQHYPIRA